jgi:DNA-binding NarL/FixJ family response regulator
MAMPGRYPLDFSRAGPHQSGRDRRSPARVPGESGLASGTIIIADDHPLFRDALAQAIKGVGRNLSLTMAATFHELEDLVATRSDIELVLLDLTMPGSRGLSGLLRLRAEYPAIPVAVVSAADDAATIRRTMKLGASGFISKSLDMAGIRAAIRTVLSGGIHAPEGIAEDDADDRAFFEIAERLKALTPQQGKVLGMLGEGLLNKQIAYELGVSEATVKAHVSAVLLKLGVDSRTQAVIAINRLGLSLNAPEG